jgi:hypothetical protein
MLKHLRQIGGAELAGAAGSMGEGGQANGSCGGIGHEVINMLQVSTEVY